MKQTGSARLAQLRRALLGTALLLALTLLAVDRYAHYAHYPKVGSRKIVVYGTEKCPFSQRLRNDLTASGIPFTEYNVETSFQGQLGFWALRGRGVPVSAVGEKIIYGYRVDELAAAAAALGYSYHQGRQGPQP